MKECKLVIKNTSGLHARPAVKVVGAAAKYKCSLTVIKGEKEANLKSLISLLSLEVIKDDSIVIKADGEDEEIAVKSIAEIIEEIET